MSLPSSEPLPNDINELPPARQRHIRRHPRLASLAERQILLESLLQLTAPTFNFFLLSLLGALALSAAFYFNEPVIFLASIVLLPFLNPIFGLALLPTSHKFGHSLKSLVSLIVPLVFSLTAGALAAWLQKTGDINQLSLNRFGQLDWLNISFLGASIILSVLIMLREGQLPRLLGVILSYEILIPLAAAGFGFILGDANLWPGALWVGFSHLFIAIVLAIFALTLFGFFPKRLLGWLLVGIPVSISLAFIFAALYFSGALTPTITQPEPTVTPIPVLSETPSPSLSESPTPAKPTTAQPTATLLPTATPSLNPTATLTATETPTPQPTTFFVVVNSLTGAVIRENPDFTAAVIGYANDGDLLEIFDVYSPQGTSIWYQVQTVSGESGWLLGSLVNTQTITPTQE